MQPLFDTFKKSQLTLRLSLTAGQVVDRESEIWGAHDSIRHGDPLDPRLMQDPVYWDGYVMECCSKRPYEQGCIISRHKPRAAQDL
jgi:hypothetical protein